MTITVSEVAVITRILDGGSFWRCASCRHPYRLAGGAPHGVCGVCNHRRSDSEPCTAEVYRASRADDAPVPYSAD